MGTRWLVPALCAASVFLFSACGDSSGPSGGGNPPPDGDVLVKNNFYDPATLQVTVGTTVTWAWNSGGITHTVTFDDGPNSGNKTSGTFERTFDATGSFPYHCLIHGVQMSGTVTVTEAVGGTGAPPGGGGGGMGGGYPGY